MTSRSYDEGLLGFIIYTLCPTQDWFGLDAQQRMTTRSLHPNDENTVPYSYFRSQLVDSIWIRPNMF